MRNVDIAVILLHQHILSYLVPESEPLATRSIPFEVVLPVDEGIIESEFEDEVPQLRLNLASRVFRSIRVRREHTYGIYGLSVHVG